MKRIMKKLGLVSIGISALVAVSCSKEYDFYDDSMSQRIYEYEWTKTFGEIDPNQDWNSATLCTANIDMTDYPSATYDVKIYTGNPMDDDSRLLVSATVSGTETITGQRTGAVGKKGKNINQSTVKHC